MASYAPDAGLPSNTSLGWAIPVSENWDPRSGWRRPGSACGGAAGNALLLIPRAVAHSVHLGRVVADEDEVGHANPRTEPAAAGRSWDETLGGTRRRRAQADGERAPPTTSEPSTPPPTSSEPSTAPPPPERRMAPDADVADADVPSPWSLPRLRPCRLRREEHRHRRHLFVEPAPPPRQVRNPRQPRRRSWSPHRRPRWHPRRPRLRPPPPPPPSAAPALVEEPAPAPPLAGAHLGTCARADRDR